MHGGIAGRRALGAGRRAQGAGRRAQDAGRRTQGAGRRAQGAGRGAQSAPSSSTSGLRELPIRDPGVVASLDRLGSLGLELEHNRSAEAGEGGLAELSAGRINRR